MNFRRLEHDLYWGLRLRILQEMHKAEGFRGASRGKGFRAYLQNNNIPPRKAYRLIKRYERLRSIWDRVFVTNESLRRKAMPDLARIANTVLAILKNEKELENDDATNRTSIPL